MITKEVLESIIDDFAKKERQAEKNCVFTITKLSQSQSLNQLCNFFLQSASIINPINTNYQANFKSLKKIDHGLAPHRN